MSSRVLNSKEMPQLQPVTELERLSCGMSKYPFTATGSEQARKWQRECRAALSELVGFLDTKLVPANPELVEEVDRKDFVRRKVLIQTSPDSRMPVYLLIPKNVSGPLPAVIAYNGHGYGVKDIVGLWDDGEERHVPDGYQDDFAVRLCRRGFFVAAPEISCFGERQADYSHLSQTLGQPVPSTCHNAATYAFMMGKSVLGLRLRDGLRLIDYLASVPECDKTRIGAMGISGGGMMTFFHTCIDERVKACVVSGYFSSFAGSVLAMDHCTCNFVPGLLTIGEHEDLYGLIAPRPALFEAGTRDSIFPIEVVRKSVARAREICAILGGNPDADVELDEFEGRHRISGQRSYDFLWEKLTT